MTTKGTDMNKMQNETKQTQEYLLKIQKQAEELKNVRFLAMAELKSVEKELKTIMHQYSEMGIVDNETLKEKLAKIDESIAEDMKELKDIESILEKYKDVDVETIQDLEELKNVNLNQDF